MTTGRNRFAFLFLPDSARWLILLRLGLGLELVSYTLLLRSDWVVIFGSAGSGLLGREVAEAMTVVQSPFIPRLGWIISAFNDIGLNERTALAAAWWALLVLGCLLVVGVWPRATAFLAWFLQLACAKSGGLFSYGVDNLISIGLFYLMIAPVLRGWSFDSGVCRSTKDMARLAGFHRRVVQIHLCMIYFFGGLAKCLGHGWWDGSNMWRTLTIPPFDLVPPGLIASVGFLLPALGLAVCLLETTYSFLIWPQATRRLVLCAICAMHLGIGLLMGMYLFAGIMLVLNLAAFWPVEWPDQQTRRPGLLQVAA